MKFATVASMCSELAVYSTPEAYFLASSHWHCNNWPKFGAMDNHQIVYRGGQSSIRAIKVQLIE